MKSQKTQFELWEAKWSYDNTYNVIKGNDFIRRYIVKNDVIYKETFTTKETNEYSYKKRPFSYRITYYRAKTKFIKNLTEYELFEEML